MNRGFGVLLVIAVAVSIISHPSGPGSATAAQLRASANGANSPVDASAANFPDPCVLDQTLSCSNCTFFCPTEPLVETIKDFFADQPDKDSPQHLNVPKSLWSGVRFIVAIVPDPAHSHLSLFFDSSIDAIEQAAQQEGYIFDRAIMPWDYQNHPEVADYRLRLRQAQFEKEREKVPGLMIFRKAYPDRNNSVVGAKDQTNPNESAVSDAPLFVFVVGETPTGGIHKDQFKNALRGIKKIRTGEASGELTGEGLRIMGPTFSGSLFSLSELLRQDEGKAFNQILVHSGTNSSWDTIDWFKNDTRCLDTDTQGKCTKGVHFVSFQESDRYAIERFIRFAEAEGYCACRIAVLSEEETAYGLEMFKKKKSATAGWQIGPEETDIVQLYFPRDISQLRSAFQHDLPVEESPEAAGRRPSRSTLHLNLEDTGSDEDSVPSYARLQTPLSQEAVLLGIVTNLQKHLAQFVVIRATNPLDQLFLVRYLRIAYPEGRIVTSGADMLFRREVENTLLHGTLAITSYSLVPGADDEVAYPDLGSGKPQSDCPGCQPERRPGPHADNVFSNAYASGTYNAMLSLLACLDSKDLESNGCLSEGLPAEPRYTEYGWPDIGGTNDPASSVLAPPLYLTALGHYGYWRLALLDSKAYEAANQPHTGLHTITGTARNVPFATYVPQPWKLFCGIFSGFVLTFLFLMWRGSVVSPSEAMANLALLPERSRTCIFFLVGLLLLAMLLMAIGPWIRWNLALHPNGWLYWFVVLGLILIIRWIAELRRRGASPVTVCTFAALSFILGITAVAFYLSGHDAQKNLFLYRYIHFASGLSPALPWLLLIAALLWWAWYNLAGLALLDERRPYLPDTKEERDRHCNQHDWKRLGSVHLTEEGNVKLLNAAHPFCWDSRIYLPVLLVGGIARVIVNYWHPVQSLEGKLYDQGYAFGLGLGILWLLCTLFRLAVVWLECRRLLLALDSLPLRRSFKWLAGFSWKPIWRLRGSILQDSFRLIERQMDSLRSLFNTIKSDAALKQERKCIFGIDLADCTQTPIDELPIFLQRNAVDESYKAASATRFDIWSFLKQLGTRLRKKPKSGPEAVQPESDSEKSAKDLISKFNGLQKKLAETCGSTLYVLTSQWNSEEQMQKEEDSRLKDKKSGASNGKCKLPDNSEQSLLPPKTRLAEEFVCLVYVNFILNVLMRMRTLVTSVAGMFVFLLLSVACYPFEPKQAMYSILIILFLLIIGMVTVVYAQMHRDATLSRITDTTPGELGFDFWIRLAGFTAVPLLSLLLAQYPGFNNFLFSWLQPVLQGAR